MGRLSDQADPEMEQLERQFADWRFWRTAGETPGIDWVIHASRLELPPHERKAGLLAKLTANSLREMAEFVLEQDALRASLAPEPATHEQTS